MAYVPDFIPENERARYTKGSMGARSGFGFRPAVLVVDMTRAFTEDRFPLGAASVADRARQRLAADRDARLAAAAVPGSRTRPARHGLSPR
jgi:hypothetical protein